MSLSEYTDSYGATVLDHLLGMVAHLQADSPICLAFIEDGISTVLDLLSLTEEDINNLEYSDGFDRRSLHKGNKGLVCILIAYIRKLQENPDFDILVDYSTVSSNGFAYYRAHEPLSPLPPSPMMTPPFKSPTPFPPLLNLNHSMVRRERKLSRDTRYFDDDLFNLKRGTVWDANI
jgi:hypothetical protein